MTPSAGVIKTRSIFVCYEQFGPIGAEHHVAAAATRRIKRIDGFPAFEVYDTNAFLDGAWITINQILGVRG